MIRLSALCIVLFAIASCDREAAPVEWAFQGSVELNGVHPIGIARRGEELWISDGDHNRLVQIDEDGTILSTIDSLDRPMHITADGESLYVPQYGLDNIAMINSLGTAILSLSDSLDAPAGISVFNKEKAIADFYNNRVLYYDGGDWISIGKEGKADGEFYYPTDVQVTAGEIWVADAYNNRVQVFDKKGGFLKKMGQDQKMNAATGIFVSDTEVFVTDFENNRVLVLDRDGNLKQALREGIEKPTDMLIKNGILCIVNYRSGALSMYKLATKKTAAGS